MNPQLPWQRKVMFAILTNAISLIPSEGFSCWAVTKAAWLEGHAVDVHQSDARAEYESLMGNEWGELGVIDVENAGVEIGWPMAEYRQFMLSMAAESFR